MGFVSALILRAALTAPLWFAAPPRGADVVEAVENWRISLFDRIAPSVVFVMNGDSFGSGFFIDDSGNILTNAHVVGKARHVRVIRHDGGEFVGDVVARAPDDVDLAVVHIKASSTPSLSVKTRSSLRIGQWAGTVGHGSGGVWTLSTGIVTNLYKSKSDDRVFQTQIPVNPGASGGPVFDRKGDVIGVITAGIASAQAVNFAISMDSARKAFPSLLGCECLTVRLPASGAVFVDGKFVGTGKELQVQLSAGSHQISAVVGKRRIVKRVTYPKQKEIVLR